MIKKYSKLFVITLLAFFISIISVNAKKMSVSELGSEILSRNPNAGYVYVIGRYAFTSSYATKFDIKDIMLAAADSININLGEIENLEDYSENMTIYQIDRISLTEWELQTNVVGNGKAYNDEAKVDVSFIDYEYIVSDTNIDANIKTQVESLNDKASDYGFESIAYDNYTATFYISDPSRNLVDYKDSGILDVIKALVAPETGAKTIAWDGHEASDITNLEDSDIIALAAEVLTKMIGKDAKTLTYAEAANKSITATVTYTDENGYKYSVDYTLTFVYDFIAEKNEILTNAAAKLDSEVKENEDYGFRGVTFKNNVLTFDIANPDALLAKFKESSIVALFKANYAGAVSVEYTTGDVSDTITLTGSEDNSDIEGYALEVLTAMAGDVDVLTLGSVAGKTAIAKVTYADGSVATYTLTFTYDVEAVKNDVLTEAAETLNSEIESHKEYGFRSVKYENNTLTFDILDPTALLANFKDSGIVRLFLENYKGATTVEYTTSNGNSGSIDLTEEELSEENVKSYAAEVLKAMIDEGASLTLGSVAGKTATAKVTYNTGDVVEYTLKFTYNVEEAKDEVLGDAATTLASEITSNPEWGFKDVTYDATQNLAKFEIADPTANLADFKESTVVKLFKEFIKGAKSVVYYIGDSTEASAPIELSDDLDDATIEGYAAEILTKMAGGEDAGLTLGAVAGKTARAVVTYEDGTEITYNLAFNYDVETVKDEALTKDAETLNSALTDHSNYGFESIVYNAKTKTATFTVKADSGDTLLSAYKESGIVDMFQKIVEGAKSISYTVNGTSKDVEMENLDDDNNVISLAAELLRAMVGQDAELKLKNVVGKTATATINYGYGEPITYTLLFNQATAE